MVGTQTVPPNPTGSDVNPDVTITTTTAVTLTIQASNIPLGTTIQLKLNSDNGPSLTIVSAPLTGTVANSTATAGPITLPNGFTRVHVTATWTP